MAGENKMAAASEKPSVPVMPKTVQAVSEAAPEKKTVFSSMFSSKKEAVKKNKVGTSVLEASIGIFIIAAVFFYTQNSKDFTLLGVNAAQKKALAAEQVDNLNGEINVERHLNAVYQLEKFARIADEYFYDLKQSKSEYVSENKKTEYKSALHKLKPDIKTAVAGIKEKLTAPMSDEVRAMAVQKINEEIASLKQKSGQVDDQTLLSDIQDLVSARKVLGNEAFGLAVKAVDTANPTDESLQNLLTEYNKVNQSVSALISGIQSSRILWSEYLAEIEAITKKIDPLFGTEFDGNLSLNGISFTQGDLKVVVSGKTNTADTKNFTLVANLIDAYELSPLFKDAQERNFSKSESSTDEGTNYDSSFEVEMTLETDPTQK